MLIRVLFVGAMLAGLTGAAVFYGFGELDGDVNEAASKNIPAVSHEITPNPNDVVISDTANVKPENKLSDVIAPKVQNNLPAAPVDETAAKKPVPEKLKTEKPASDTLKDMLDKSKNVEANYDNAKGSDAEKVKTKKAKDVMKPRATGAFIVKDETADTTQNPSPEIPLADLSDEDVISISESLIKARNTANKTQRDKIYLEIFDNAIESGSIELAARVSDKLSTPKLRELTRGIIDNTGK